VSAGGIGSNFCRILRDSFFKSASASILDPDLFDISNLNRAIGVGITGVGKSKASIAADWLRSCSDDVFAGQVTYESWINTDIAAEFRQPGTAVAVGVDQVRTRLAIGSEWPSMLLNGATSGSTFSTGIHMRQGGGCIGCWYGQDEASYAATRTPMACVAGVAPGAIELRNVASYPFVSVAAAASMVASLVRVLHQREAWRDCAGKVVSMSLRSPECAEGRYVAISQRCLLLCAADYLQLALGRSTEGRGN
jgi:hypothetical protein